MKKFINHSFLLPEDLNALYTEGFRFRVKCNYHITNSLDGWTGMRIVENDYMVFDNEDEATAFSLTQNWVYNSDVHSKVEIIPEHTETFEEAKIRLECEKQERAARRLAKMIEKANTAGLTLEEYKEVQRKTRLAKTLAKEIKEHEAEIEKLKNEIVRKTAMLKELEG